MPILRVINNAACGQNLRFAIFVEHCILTTSDIFYNCALFLFVIFCGASLLARSRIIRGNPKCVFHSSFYLERGPKGLSVCIHLIGIA